MSKLTDDLVIHAYILMYEGWQNHLIANALGVVCEDTIGSLRRRDSWSHLYNTVCKSAPPTRGDTVIKDGKAKTDTKITAEIVLTIYDLVKSKNFKRDDIAKMFSVSPTTISDLTAGRTWKHLHNIFLDKTGAKHDLSNGHLQQV